MDLEDSKLCLLASPVVSEIPPVAAAAGCILCAAVTAHLVEAAVIWILFATHSR